MTRLAGSFESWGGRTGEEGRRLKRPVTPRAPPILLGMEKDGARRGHEHPHDVSRARQRIGSLPRASDKLTEQSPERDSFAFAATPFLPGPGSLVALARSLAVSVAIDGGKRSRSVEGLTTLATEGRR
jgi:hypothetical protein